MERVIIMVRKQCNWFRLCSLTLLFVLAAACGNGQSEQKGNDGIIGLFGKKDKKTVTIVASEVGGVLEARPSEPETMPPPIAPGFPQCQLGHIRGNPPDAQWVPEEVSGETRRVFRIPGDYVQPPLAILSSGGDLTQVELWELSDDNISRFLKQRPVALDAGQDSWSGAYPLAVSCLPGGRVLLAVGYHDPRPKNLLLVYTPANNRFRRIGLIEPVMSVLPFTYFETLFAAPEAVLVQFYTDIIRLKADDYIYQYYHIWLFSPRYPDGLEILKLGIDDGNVHAWGMQNKTLWLKTHDKRKKPTDFLWSMDLSKVL
ncbi:MAG: hypothetical protein GY737_09925 [Desulfobacteraceae bacterium]|nr:hypothetical protein [Desulfobacteraceae bacterium]